MANTVWRAMGTITAKGAYCTAEDVKVALTSFWLDLLSEAMGLLARKKLSARREKIA